MYSVPLMVTLEPAATLVSSIAAFTVPIVDPMVYPLEPMVMDSPVLSAVIVNLAVPVPTPVSVPSIPASFALTLTLDVFPLPFNR